MNEDHQTLLDVLGGEIYQLIHLADDAKTDAHALHLLLQAAHALTERYDELRTTLERDIGYREGLWEG